MVVVDIRGPFLRRSFRRMRTSSELITIWRRRAYGPPLPRQGELCSGGVIDYYYYYYYSEFITAGQFVCILYKYISYYASSSFLISDELEGMIRC